MWKECLALSLSELVIETLGCASAISGKPVASCAVGGGWGRRIRSDPYGDCDFGMLNFFFLVASPVGKS